MAVTDKSSHDTTPPPSYEEVQLKDKGKDVKGEDDKGEEKEGEEKKTELEIPPVGLFELVGQCRAIRAFSQPVFSSSSSPQH